MSQEMKIADVCGDELLVIWDWEDDGDHSAVMLEDLRNKGIKLDLSGIAKLRAALDQAEAAFHRREVLKHNVSSLESVVASAPTGSVILSVWDHVEPFMAMPNEIMIGQRVLYARAYELRQKLSAGLGVTDVWLSKHASTQAGDIPQGIRVWREEARA